MAKGWLSGCGKSLLTTRSPKRSVAPDKTSRDWAVHFRDNTGAQHRGTLVVGGCGSWSFSTRSPRGVQGCHPLEIYESSYAKCDLGLRSGSGLSPPSNTEALGHNVGSHVGPGVSSLGNF